MGLAPGIKAKGYQLESVTWRAGSASPRVLKEYKCAYIYICSYFEGKILFSFSRVLPHSTPKAYSSQPTPMHYLRNRNAIDVLGRKQWHKRKEWRNSSGPLGCSQPHPIQFFCRLYLPKLFIANPRRIYARSSDFPSIEHTAKECFAPGRDVQYAYWMGYGN